MRTFNTSFTARGEPERSHIPHFPKIVHNKRTIFDTSSVDTTLVIFKKKKKEKKKRYNTVPGKNL